MSISIIIAHQNKRPEWLKECLDSIKEQTLQPLEVIQETGEGTVQDRYNLGVSKAKGKYVVLFADDDKMPPNFLSNLYEFAEKHNTPISSPFLCNFGKESGMHGPGVHPFFSSLIRKDVYEEVGGLENDMLQMADVDLWAKCMGRGYKWAVVPDTFYFYRTHADQDSVTGNYKIAREKYLKKHGKFLEN